MTITLDLDASTLAALEARAKAAGLPDAASFAKRALEQIGQPAGEQLADVNAWLNEITGSAKGSVTSDEIMELTRGES